MLGSLLEIIPAVLSNWQSTCPEKLLEKNESFETILCGDVFWTLCEKVPICWRNCFPSVVKTAFQVSKK